MSNSKIPTNLSGTEIISFLNSGKYVSPSTRQQLEDQLKEDRQYNRFSPLDEFFATIVTDNQKNITQKTKMNGIEDFPSLNNNLDKKIEPQTVLNFTTFANSDKSINESVQIQNKSLFDNDNLVLPFIYIQQMYDYYTIHRIRLQYVCLNRKINILNSIEKVNQIKGKIFKQKFNFTNMIDNESNAKKCITIHIALNELEFIHKKILPQLLKKCQKILSTKKILDAVTQYHFIDKIKALCKKYDNFIAHLTEKFAKYQTDIQKSYEFTKNILSNIIMLDEEKILQYIDESINVSNVLSKLNVKIIDDNDPHTNCEYYVVLDNKQSSPTRGAQTPIYPIGLSTFIYLPCEQNIDLSTKNKSFDSDVLNSMSEYDLELYFNKNKVDNDSHHIRLNFKNSKIKTININYDLDEIIPKQKMFVKITDSPTNVSVWASVLRNYDLDEIIQLPPIPGINNSKFWLKKCMNNLSYRISEEEYNLLHPSWKEIYSYTDTSKNIFIVDYLFNEMLMNDSANLVIKPNMLNSFRNFAYNTSSNINNF